MASGERPFKGDSAISILSSIVRDAPRPLTEVVQVQPRGLWRIVRRALAKDVEARYQSAKDLRNDLRELKQDSQVTAAIAAPISVATHPLRWRLGAALAAAALAALGWLAFGREGRATVQADAPRQVIRFQITNPMPAMPRPENAHQSVAITRDGSLIAYGTPSEDLSAPGGRLYLRSLDGVTRPVSDLVPAFTPAFSPDGDRLVFRVGTNRYYVTSVKGGAPVLAVEPIAVVDDIVTEPADGLTPYAISDNGTLVYLQGRAQRYRRQVVVFDRRGRETPLLESGPYSFVRASPTGEYVALSAYGANVRTWLFDLRRKTLGLLTETWSNEGPAWSHDGTRLAHSSTRGGETELYVAGVLSPSETKLQDGSEISSIKAFSADDQYVLVSDFGDIFRIRSDGSGGKEALVTSGAREAAPHASPEGKWLAFQSDDTGRFEVYVVPYASGGRRQQVSRNGGQQPRWTMQGRELCYRAGLTMSSIACVAIEPDGSAVGESRVVVNLEDAITSWDVSPDGQRFYVIKNAIEGWQPTAPLQVVINWFDELRAKMARSER